MLSITENIKELKKIINKQPFNKNVALEFLYAIKENAIQLEKEITESESQAQFDYEIITELEDIIERREGINEIDCGIGNINYEKPGNLVLIDIMENLETAIKKTTPKKVNEVLSAI